MRRPRLITLAAALAVSSWALTSAPVRAADRPGEDQSAKQFSQPAPVKQFDLGKLDLSKPPVEPAPPVPPEKANQPKPKPVVRYRATELVPEGAAITLEIPDLSRARRGAGLSPLGRLMAADALGPFWHRNIVQRARNLPPVGEGLPNGDALVELFNRVSDLLSGEVVVAAYPAADGAKGVRLLLVGELEGVRRTAFLDTVEDFKTLAGLSRETLAADRSKDEFDYHELTAKNGLMVTWGFVGNQLVVDIGRTPQKAGRQFYADVVLPAAVSRGDKSLAREEARTEQMAILGKDADYYLRVDVKALAGLAASAKGKAQPLPGIGLEGVKYAAASLRFESGAAREKLYLAMDPESRLGKLLPKSPPSADLAKFMPLDACYFEVKRLEPGAANLALETFKSSLSEESGKKIDEEIAEFDKKAGMSLEKDILPALSGELASAYTVRTVGAGPEVELVVVIQPDDLDKFKKAMTAMERAMVGAGEIKAEHYLGAQLRYLEKPKDAGRDAARDSKATPEDPFARRLGAPGPKGMVPLALNLTQFNAYALQGQWVILGTSTRIVKQAVRQKDPAQHTSSIGDKADFKTTRAVLGAPANELSYGYLDLHRVGEMLYALAGTSGMVADLPPADRVLEEMTGMAWSLRREKKGVSVEVVSPVGMLAFGAALLTKGALDAVDSAAAAEQASHTAKLKAIWRGMELFSTEFGRYPLNLSELYPAYVAEGSAFLTPDQEEGEAKASIAKAEEVDVKTGYRYVSGRTPGSVGTTLLVYSVKPTVQGTHWCLFVNGKIREVPAKGLAELIGGKKPAAKQASVAR